MVIKSLFLFQKVLSM